MNKYKGKEVGKLYINHHQYSWYTGTLYSGREEMFCVHINKSYKPLKNLDNL